MLFLPAVALGLTGVVVSAVSALEPPTTEQIDRYREDGSLARRVDAARRIGNHRMSPALLGTFRRSLDVDGGLPGSTTKVMPSSGRLRVFALLVEFSDYQGRNPEGDIDRRLFGAGFMGEFPYESLRNYYRRSSYGLLEFEGVTLGWYTAPYPQSAVPQTDEGREGLIQEAIDHYDGLGHDFSRYDNDGDGEIDYFLVFYAGPHQEWGDFWWGYQRTFQNDDYTVDGLRLGTYSWQWEAWEVGGPFSARVAIHETGHALGLPDYYDYDDTVGPDGGLGGLDMMDGNWGDHNAFSKWVLGWLDAEVVNEGQEHLVYRPSATAGDGVVLMHGHPVQDPYHEYFLVQHRGRTGNDIGYPTDGLVIWHVDARLDNQGRFLFDNSYTEHKLIRLMEADGLEEIEQNLGADAGDFFRPGDVFSDTTVPDSRRYDTSPTGVAVDGIVPSGGSMAFDVDLGSGCGIFGAVGVPATAWPGITTPFRVELDFANCDGDAEPEWVYGDGDTGSGASADHVYSSRGVFEWELETRLGDAALIGRGSVRVCDDPRCYRWRPEAEMRGPRLQHSAVVLRDGRVLVVGGGVPPEIFDPGSWEWQPAAGSVGTFDYASAQLLADDRVLVTGSRPGDPVNAEIYDPSSDSWSVTARMKMDRVMHSSIRLVDGRVLVAGGLWDGGVSLAEIFDPVTGSWSDAGSTVFEEVPGLALLPDGEVLLVGRKRTQIFNPVTGRWRRISDLMHEHKWGATVTLADGRIMVVGGEGTSETEIFDPVLNLWRPGAPLANIRAVPSAVVLPSGQVVATGGADRFWRVGSGVEVWDPVTKVWTEVAAMADVRLAHTATVLSDGSVLVTGGTASVLAEPYIGKTSAERFVLPVEQSPARRPGGRRSP